MKTPIPLGLALLALAPASAQVFRPETVNGAVIGGIAGAVIGHNSGSLGHNGWRGAAWGAGLGWVLGSVADANRRAVIWERPPVYVESARPVVVQAPAQPAPAAAPQQVTIINNYYGNAAPMGQANTLFGR